MSSVASFTLDEAGSAQKKIKIDQDAKFPTQHHAQLLPKRAAGTTCRPTWCSINKDEDGSYDRFAVDERQAGVACDLWVARRSRSTGAGPRVVEVTGALSRLNAQRVCGNSTCHG